MSGPGDGASRTSESRWRTVRRLAYGAYTAVLIWFVIVHGIPTGRLALAAIVMSGLLLTSIGRGLRQTRQVFLDWLPFTAVLILYDRTRGVADSLGISLHEADITHAEQWVFGGTVPSAWLQQQLYDPAQVHWYDALCTLVYTSHFIVTPALAAVLWVRDRSLWVRYISRVIVLSIGGLITYCLFPEAPPWLAAQDGLTEPVARLSARGWSWLRLGDVQSTLSSAQNEGANPVAAMPSLHIGFAVLAAVFIATRLRSRWRYLLVLYPLAMGFTLVYTGEHWVLDLVAGLAYALAAHWAVSWWEARRRDRPGHAGTAPPEARLERGPGTNVAIDSGVASGASGIEVAP